MCAKFTPGAIISEIRGTIASTTFSKNAAGAIIRNRVVPINRNSTLQANQRQKFGNISSGWRALSEAERASWIAAAADFPYQDSLGQTKFLSGAQLFEKFTLNLAVIDEAQVDTAPSPASFDEIALGAVTLTDAAFTVAFTPDPVPAGMAMVWYATRPISAGKSFVNKSDFRFIQFEDPAAVSPVNLFAAYEAAVSTLTGQEDKKVFIEARYIQVATGVASAAVRTSAIVA
jgi:hypothetical protein